MSETWYQTDREVHTYDLTPKIRPVEVEHSTPKFIKIVGEAGLRAKMGFYAFFPTRQAAVLHIDNKLLGLIARARADKTMAEEREREARAALEIWREREIAAEDAP